MKRTMTGKSVYVLVEERDYDYFKSKIEDEQTENILWFPISSSLIGKFILEEPVEEFYLPNVFDERECSNITKHCYQEAKGMLRQVLIDNNIVNHTAKDFPLEWFWTRSLIAVNMMLLYCEDLLRNHQVEEVNIVKRNQQVNYADLLISFDSFLDAIGQYFEAKSVRVKTIIIDSPKRKIETIFFTDATWRKLIKRIISFALWKPVSSLSRNYEYLLIKPGYHNIINYDPRYIYTWTKTSPQAYNGIGFPFLHSILDTVKYLIKRRNAVPHVNTDPVRFNSYYFGFREFKLDVPRIFKLSLERYIKDLSWMEKYITLFWDMCIKRSGCRLIIFSLSPVLMDSYFLIKKIREANGKVAVWQHGGFYGYSEHYLNYLSDFRNIDFFLSYGKIHDKQNFSTNSDGLEKTAEIIEVGMPVTKKSSWRKWLVGKAANGNGLYFPAVIQDFYQGPRAKFDFVKQYKVAKEIIEYFGSGIGGKVAIKALVGHKTHLLFRKHFTEKKNKHLEFITTRTDKVFNKSYKYVVLDNPSTPLIQVLAMYTGPVFLLVAQESWKIREDALMLLRKRVVYSECIEELKDQLTSFFNFGTLGNVDINDTSFTDLYVKRFDYNEYKHFLDKASLYN